MTEGAFWQSVNEIKILTNKLRLKKYFGEKRGVYSSDFLNVMYSDDYRTIYDCAIKNFDFEILLIDESFFQFSFEDDCYSLAYYPRPSKFIQFDEWLLNIFVDNTNFNQEEFERFKEEMIVDGDIHSEYEQFLSECETLLTILPIRFDCDKSNYSEIYHPFCHLHVGLDNHIRIAFDKFISPLTFFHFIIKNYFPDIFFYRDKKGVMKINEVIFLKDRLNSKSIPKEKFVNENLIIHFT